MAAVLLAGCGAPREAEVALSPPPMVDGMPLPPPPAPEAPPRPAPPLALPPAAADSARMARILERLPAEAARFHRGPAMPVRQPAEGVEVDYAIEGRRAAGFVQVLHSAATAEAEYARWRREVTVDARPGRELRVTEEFSQRDGPGFRCAMLAGDYGRQPVRGMICVGAAGGHLLRLRVTMVHAAEPVADARGFLAGVTAALRGV